MNVVTKQALGFLGAFLALFLVVGAGIELVLRTMTSDYLIAAAVVLALVAVSLLVTTAVAISARPSVTNPYWSPK